MRNLLFQLVLSLSVSCGTNVNHTPSSNGVSELVSDSASDCPEDWVPVEGKPTELLFPTSDSLRGCDQEQGVDKHCKEYWGSPCETFQETLATFGWPDAENRPAIEGWTAAHRCSGPDSTPYDVFTYGDDHGGLSVYVFDVSGSMISSGHTLIWDFSEHYKYCCSGEEREFIYYGDFPPLDCDGGEYAPDAFDDTGG